MAHNYILYGSQLTQALSYEGLKDLLETSQHNNARDGITGFLHIEDRTVLQYLEGPPGALQQTVARIQADPRHSQFLVLDQNVLKRRYFDEWNMALVETATLSLGDLVGAPQQDGFDIRSLNPTDLITLLTANASFLRQQPGIVA